MITCHKSQGGQWNTVFIEQPYLPNGQRLHPMAVYRDDPSQELYLIGFKDESLWSNFINY
jgi:exodeoxyribonuclease-5